MRVIGCVRWVIVGGGLVWATLSHAGTERFDYDALGRLVRHVDSSGTITEYAYDPVGNILEVRRSADAGPPRVSDVSPTSVRRGRTVRVTLSGSRMAGARVSSPDAELEISGLASAATAVGFTLGVSTAATVGARVFTVTTATGEATFSLQIEPQLPVLAFAPAQLVLTPGQSQQVTLSLSNADQVAHEVSLNVAPAAAATVSPTTLSYPPGQTAAVVDVAAIATGTAILTASSSTLLQATLGIHVAAPQAGPATAYALPVGIERQEGPGGGSGVVGPVSAPIVGVLRQEGPAGGTSVVGPVAAPMVGVLRQEGPAGGTSVVGPVAAPMVGVLRQEGPAGGTSVVGPVAAPMVGVLRQEGPAGGTSVVGPVAAPMVGLLRQEGPAGGTGQVGPIVAPTVGVRRD